MALISVGIDHEHAPLELLERVTVAEGEWPKVLRTLASHRNVHEAVFVSTCLRTEVVAVVDRFHDAIDETTRVLSEASGVEVAAFTDRLSVAFEHDVVTHLFEVAAGLRSVVPGEYEILGQLRRALELAVEEQSAGPVVSELFTRAIAAGRRVRAETGIARGTTSFAHAAAAAGLEELGDDLAGSRAVVVGAGQMGAGVARALLGARPGPGRLVLVNRTPERAEALAADLDDGRVEVERLERLDAALEGARLVVVAVETPTPLVQRTHLAGRPDVVVVDLGLPRAVDPAVDGLAGVVRIDISHLRERVDRALGDRREAIDAARAIVTSEAARFLDDQRARGAAVIVRELREHFDDVVATELERRAHELAGLDGAGRDLVTSVVRSVVAKIAHRPTVALKESAGTDQGTRLGEAVRALFDL
ncbi:MAG TPA: glutamyl-tRNA reductase [Acidimicrobiales bacterium]|nr:glutamyl-tRNA reductase [Acidimicrobiales bacterium]